MSVDIKKYIDDSEKRKVQAIKDKASSLNMKKMHDAMFDHMHDLVSSDSQHRIGHHAFNLHKQYNSGLSVHDIRTLYLDRHPEKRNVKEDAPGVSTGSVSGAGSDTSVPMRKNLLFKNKNIEKLLRRLSKKNLTK